MLLAAAWGDTSSRQSDVWPFRGSRACLSSGSRKEVAVSHKPLALYPPAGGPSMRGNRHPVIA